MSEQRVMPSPRSVDIAVTGRCNLSCAYCFYADEMVARTDLPTESWLSFFDELGRLAVMEVTLTGGEVFTRHDLFELIDGIIANRMRYGLLSNGTLITERVIEQFAVGKRRQRLNQIQVSIDGSRAEVHDLSRPHSFDRAIRGLRLLKSAGFPVIVRVTINRHNVDDLENVAAVLLEDVGLPSFTVNEAFPCGATDRGDGEVMLTPEQRERAMIALGDLAARYDGRISATAGPLAVAQHLAQIKTDLAAGLTGRPGRGRLSACGGVFNKLAVMHDGTVVPCHNLSTLPLGTVGTDDLRQIWAGHPQLQALRARRDIPLQSLATCRDCPYQGFCSGSCPGPTLFLTNELNARNPMDCYRVILGEVPFSWAACEGTCDGC